MAEMAESFGSKLDLLNSSPDELANSVDQSTCLVRAVGQKDSSFLLISMRLCMTRLYRCLDCEALDLSGITFRYGLQRDGKLNPESKDSQLWQESGLVIQKSLNDGRAESSC